MQGPRLLGLMWVALTASGCLMGITRRTWDRETNHVHWPEDRSAAVAIDTEQQLYLRVGYRDGCRYLFCAQLPPGFDRRGAGQAESAEFWAIVELQQRLTRAREQHRCLRGGGGITVAGIDRRSKTPRVDVCVRDEHGCRFGFSVNPPTGKVRWENLPAESADFRAIEGIAFPRELSAGPGVLKGGRLGDLPGLWLWLDDGGLTLYDSSTGFTKLVVHLPRRWQRYPYWPWFSYAWRGMAMPLVVGGDILTGPLQWVAFGQALGQTGRW